MIPVGVVIGATTTVLVRPLRGMAVTRTSTSQDTPVTRRLGTLAGVLPSWLLRGDDDAVERSGTWTFATLREAFHASDRYDRGEAHQMALSK